MSFTPDHFSLAQNVTSYRVDSSLLSFQVFLNYICKCLFCCIIFYFFFVGSNHAHVGTPLSCLLFLAFSFYRSLPCHFLPLFPRFYCLCSSLYFPEGLFFMFLPSWSHFLRFFFLLLLSWAPSVHHHYLRHYLLLPSEFFHYFCFIVILHRRNCSVSFDSCQNYLDAISILFV